MTRITITRDTKLRLLETRNQHGLLDMNSTINYLLDISGLATKEDVEEIINRAFGIIMETTEEPETKPEPRVEPVSVQQPEPVPVVPQTPVQTPVIREVTCPKCQHKFMTDILKPVTCPNCGLSGKSD